MAETETLCNGRWLRLMRRGRWEYAERTNPGGAVMIAALTPGGRLLLVEQFRPSIGCNAIELPAGLVGDLPGSTAEGAREAAHRELLEETGYRAGRLDVLTEGPVSAGMSNETMAFAVASELVREHSGGGDGDEDITVHEITLGGLPAWLRERRAAGCSIDPKIYIGLYLLEHAEAFTATAG